MPPGNWQLVFNDEFSGSSVDTTKWNVLNNVNYGTGGKEDQCYFARNASVSNGTLKIAAKRETVECSGKNPDTGKNTYYATSAFLTTRGQNGMSEKFAFTKGYAEASIKLAKGNPYWGAFWLVGGSGAPGWPDYGEMDVMEQLGSYPDAVIQTLHYGCATGDGHCNTTSSNMYNFTTGEATYNRGTQLTSSNFSSFSGATTTQFVRYGLEWDDKKLTWYVNGRPTRSFDGKDMTIYTTDTNGTILTSKVVKTLTAVQPSWETMLNYPHTIILNQAFGGAVPKNNGYTGGETSTGYNWGNFAATEPGVMEVDYVRVYKKGSGPVVPPVEQADTTKPTVAITSPQHLSTVTGDATFNIDARDNKGVTKVELYADGDHLKGTDASAPYSIRWDTSTALSGTHTFTAKAYDAAGNEATSARISLKLQKDTTGPSVTISSPANNARVGSGTTTVRANASDASGVGSMKLSIDGYERISVDSATLSYNWDTRRLARNSVHTIVIEATDIYGNVTNKSIVVTRR